MKHEPFSSAMMVRWRDTGAQPQYRQLITSLRFNVVPDTLKA